jgi:hypothetical protein
MQQADIQLLIIFAKDMFSDPHSVATGLNSASAFSLQLAYIQILHSVIGDLHSAARSVCNMLVSSFKILFLREACIDFLCCL